MHHMPRTAECRNLSTVTLFSFLRPSGTGMISLISSAEMPGDCESKFASLVRVRD